MAVDAEGKPIPVNGRCACGIPKDEKHRIVKHKSVASLINKLDTATAVRDKLKKGGSDVSQVAINDEIACLEAQLAASSEFHKKQEQDAEEFREDLRKKHIARLGLTGLVGPDNVVKS